MRDIVFSQLPVIRNKQPLSVIILGIDHFKEYNDEFGHPEGDKVLKTFGEILISCTRDTDIAARIGGEEFSIILPNAYKQNSMDICERYHAAISKYSWHKRNIEASFGIATICGSNLSQQNITEWSHLYKNADKALYYSKQHGRNQIIHFDDMNFQSAVI